MVRDYFSIINHLLKEHIVGQHLHLPFMNGIKSSYEKFNI